MEADESNDGIERHLFIEIEKKESGYDATLSDDSIDRDGEFFSPELIKEWASGGAMPFLADHRNSMSSFIGAWTNPTVVQEGSNTKLKMTPQFFSEKANPLAQQVKQQIDEATVMKLRVGLSIGFIPMEGRMVDGRFMHTKAELVEGSAVPVQSNRHAGISLAKSFVGRKSNGFKRTSVIQNFGDGRMATLEEVAKELATVKAQSDALKADFDAFKAKVVSESEGKETATKEQLAAMQKAHEENTKKMDAFLKEQDAVIKKMQEAHGRVPKSVLGGAAGAGKDGKQAEAGAGETFSATKAYAKAKGITEDE